MGTPPASNVVDPVVVSQRESVPDIDRLFSAEANTGMGDFLLSPTFEMVPPSGGKANDYQKVITIATVSGF